MNFTDNGIRESKIIKKPVRCKACKKIVEERQAYWFDKTKSSYYCRTCRKQAGLDTERKKKRRYKIV